MKDKQYILFYAPGLTDEDLFGQQARDNCTEPFIALRSRCEELGYKLEVFNDHDINDCLWIIFWDVRTTAPESIDRQLRHFLKNVILRSKSRILRPETLRNEYSTKLALILAEPPSVCKENFDLVHHESFDVIFTWKKVLVDNKRYFHALLPVTSKYPQIAKWPFLNKKLVVDISGNKFSLHDRELYTARRETIQFFENRFANDFDLFGTGWKDNKITTIASKLLKGNIDWAQYKSFRGSVRNKWDVLPKYKFAICYENIEGEVDYVSNRIFDVLRCHCVPIYWGAPNINEYVDKEAFIDRTDFSSNEELAKYISNITEDQYQEFIDAGERYLNEDKFRMFLSEEFVNMIINTLKLRTMGSETELVRESADRFDTGMSGPRYLG